MVSLLVHDEGAEGEGREEKEGDDTISGEEKEGDDTTSMCEGWYRIVCQYIEGF